MLRTAGWVDAAAAAVVVVVVVVVVDDEGGMEEVGLGVPVCPVSVVGVRSSGSKSPTRP
jgi:hypothetical protein